MCTKVWNKPKFSSVCSLNRTAKASSCFSSTFIEPSITQPEVPRLDDFDLKSI